MKELIEAVAVEVMPGSTPEIWKSEIWDCWVYHDENLEIVKWNPLTDMNHAWMVVERMRELKYSMSLDVWQNDLYADEEKVLVGTCKVSFFGNGKIKVKLDKQPGKAILLAAKSAIKRSP